jgi:hypothetical protein
MEANSIEIMDFVQNGATAVWNKHISIDDMNLIYKKRILEVETMIMLHYFAGSKYKTKFWEFSKKRGEECIELAFRYDDNFFKMIKYATEIEDANYCENIGSYGHWPASAFNQNIKGLGIKKSLLKLMH